CFRHILKQYPNHVGALTHLGITLCHKGAFTEGADYYERALALQPDYRNALNNLGNALHALGKTTEAIDVYKRVISAQPDDPEGHKNMAMSLLMLGRFDEGWREYECRWQTTQLTTAQRNFSQPQWHGEDARGLTLLIHAEQGFGDTLQFCRYAPLAAARGIKIVLEVQPELVRLMNSLVGIEKVIGRGEPLPDFDLHCPMMSLPLAFGTQVETIPAEAAYLSAPPESSAKWQKRLGDSKCFRVGLIWAGNPRLFSSDLAAANRRRSMPPERLAPLIEVENIEFYSLQKDSPQPSAELGLIDLMAECSDFADTAALIANLDLVISVDTAAAHLAAAIGKPVWLLNRYDSCWRWFRSRDDSPWYPTTRLFRQSRPGDWGSVIEAVRGELERIDRGEIKTMKTQFEA
ncbi:MAG: tetratricopeptide repeat protein, partial [Alphaproteobacteria bacterium]